MSARPEPTEEAQAVAAAMVRQRWGESGAVDAADIRRAEQFIAAADALIAFRMAQHGPKGLPPALCSRIAVVANESAPRRDTEGGLDRNEDGA